MAPMTEQEFVQSHINNLAGSIFTGRLITGTLLMKSQRACSHRYLNFLMS